MLKILRRLHVPDAGRDDLPRPVVNIPLPGAILARQADGHIVLQPRHIGNVQRALEHILQQYALRERSCKRHVAGLFIVLVRNAVNNCVFIV